MWPMAESRVRSLPGGCGVELELTPGQLIDETLTDADSAKLRAALRDHRAVLVRGQDQLQVGGLDWLCRHVLGGAPYDPREHGAELLDPERSRSYMITNVANATTGRLREGELVSGSADAGSTGNHQWHTDYCWKPTMNLLLCRRFNCIDGGQTQLADTHAALNALPAPTRERLKGLETIHGGVNFPAVRQPLIVKSLLSGLPALLVGRHVKGVVGLSEEESVALLNELNDHCSRPEFVCAVVLASSLPGLRQLCLEVHS